MNFTIIWFNAVKEACGRNSGEHAHAVHLNQFVNQTEFISVDIYLDKLIVRFTTIGHEIMYSLLWCLANQNAAEIFRPGSAHALAGNTTVRFIDGQCRTPDHSIREFRPDGDTGDIDTSTPTIVFEVAYSQSSFDLAKEAARHICLTRGQVLLVIAIDIVHEPRLHGAPRVLRSVRWSHWEEDVMVHHPCRRQGARLNVVSAERNPGENDDVHCLPPATAFTAKVRAKGSKQTYNIRAYQTESWEVWWILSAAAYRLTVP